MCLSEYLVIINVFLSPIQNAIVIQLAQWTVCVVPEDSVCATGTLLDLNATSVLQVITAIPAACVSTSLSSFYWGLPSYCYSTEENIFSHIYCHQKLPM